MTVKVTYRSSLGCRLKVPTLENATQAVDAEMTLLSAKSSAQSLLLSFHFQISSTCYFCYTFACKFYS